MVISEIITAPPEELIPQFDYVKEISEQFGFVNIGVKNYEADSYRYISTTIFN